MPLVLVYIKGGKRAECEMQVGWKEEAILMDNQGLSGDPFTLVWCHFSTKENDQNRYSREQKGGREEMEYPSGNISMNMVC